MRHGTRYAYDTLGCRCQACRDACSAHVKKRRHRYIAEGKCPYCGEPPATGGQLCDECKATRREARSERCALVTETLRGIR